MNIFKLSRSVKIFSGIIFYKEKTVIRVLNCLWPRAIPCSKVKHKYLFEKCFSSVETALNCLLLKFTKD